MAGELGSQNFFRYFFLGGVQENELKIMDKKGRLKCSFWQKCTLGNWAVNKLWISNIYICCAKGHFAVKFNFRTNFPQVIGKIDCYSPHLNMNILHAFL